VDKTFINILQKLIAEQGKEVLLNELKCKSLLADYTKGEFKKESRLLLQALEANVQKTIDAAYDLLACKKQQIRLLHEEYGLDEKIAADVVDTLAFVLKGEEKMLKNNCKNCGKEMQKEWKACPYCGTLVEQSTTKPDVKKPLEVKPTIEKQPQNSAEIFAKWRFIRTFEGHEGTILSVAFSSDGKYIVSGSSRFLGLRIESKGGTLKLWEAASGRLVHTFEGYNEMVYSVAFSPDGKYIVVSGAKDNNGNCILILYETISGRPVRTFEGHEYGTVWSVAYSSNGKYIVSGSGDNILKLWDAGNGHLISTFEGHENDVRSVTFSPDCKYILSGSKDKTLKLWEVASRRLVRTFEGHENTVCSVAFGPDGKYIVSGSDDKTLKLWEAVSGRLVHTFEGHENIVCSVAFSIDGKYIASGSMGNDNNLKLWETGSGYLVRTFEGHNENVNAVAFSPNGKYLVSGSKVNNNLILWGL